jgi:hypothetical protein
MLYQDYQLLQAYLEVVGGNIEGEEWGAEVVDVEDVGVVVAANNLLLFLYCN